MPFLFSYLLKFSLSLMVMYLFYQLVLRKLTFYQWNRFYLLGYSLLCFVIPLIHIDGWIQHPGFSESRIITIIPALGQYPAAVPPAAAAPVVARVWGLYDWLGLALLSGTVLMAGRLAVLFLSLQRLRRKSVLLSADGQMNLFETEAAITPFSFGRSVYFNATRHTEEELQQIMRHEYVHIRQRHTIDLLLGELLCLVNWYNPFAWLIRYSIRQNLEFIADSNVLENGVDRKEYQYLLLKVVGISQYRIANHFNFSNLKKRIIMMNKMKSARLHLGRFLFVLPLLAVLLVAFRGTHTQVGEGSNAGYFITSGIVLDLVSKEPLPGAQVTETRSGVTATTDAKGFYRISIPVQAADSPYHYVASLEGYEQAKARFKWGTKPNVSGLIELLAMKPLKGSGIPGMYIPSYAVTANNGPVTADPSYEDALKAYYSYLKQMKYFEHLSSQMKNNPEVTLFYTTEDNLKQIVFLKDFRIEKYGYPGTPAVTEMEKKYGHLPSFSKNEGQAPSYYNKHWQEISDKLEKTFVPVGHAAKAIVFPGDSRVLVQFTTGKVVIYDMDYDKERGAFESLFGKLEAAPPPSRSDDAPLSAPSASSPPGAFSLPAAPAPDADTTPAPGVKISLWKNGKPDTLRFDGTFNGSTTKGEPLILVDGMEKTALSNVNPADIESISVLKDIASTQLYGDRGRNGVILITTKKKKPRVNDTLMTDTLRVKADTVRWSATTHTLSLSGNASLANRDVTMTAFEIHLDQHEVRLAVDGKLVAMDQDYTLVKEAGHRYDFIPLEKEAAQKKYGVSTKNGILEINTL